MYLLNLVENEDILNKLRNNVRLQKQFYFQKNGYSNVGLVNDGTSIVLYDILQTKYQSIISAFDTFVAPQNGPFYRQGNSCIWETSEDIVRALAVEKSGVLFGGF